MDDLPALYTRSRLGLLLRVKAQSYTNQIARALRDAPIRLMATGLLVALVWFGLYMMFRLVFDQFRRTPLEATVAIPLVFNFFFVAMLFMLAFSNAIITYSSLFGRTESTYLLTSPLTTLDVITLKYLEGLVIASWSLVVLGLPLMMALAHRATNSKLAVLSLNPPGNEWTFYVLFMAFFLAFIPIPAAIGLVMSWAAARFFPRRALRFSAVIAAVAVAAFIFRGVRLLRLDDTATESWIRSFLSRISFIESSFLPNYWVSKGIDHAMHGQLSESVLFLGVTIANALLLSWLAVRFVAKRFDTALERASTAGSRAPRRAQDSAAGLPGLVFFYLPGRLRLIAAKDLRTFFRDPMQWTQLVILFGLMVLYLTNMPTLTLQFSTRGWALVIPFLNLCAVSLILATFTCRFVFPLVSLEGRQLWMIGLLPVKRGHILIAKLAFAMTVCVLVGVSAMGLATWMLGLQPIWAAIHLLVTAAICFGLCGFSVGLGARLPMFQQTSMARIAGSLGGTTNLLASVALVTVILTGVGVATWRSRELSVNAWPDATSFAYCGGAAVAALLAGAIAMWIGARHFAKVEV